MQIASFLRPVIVSPVACPDLPYFPTLSHNGIIFGNKITEYNTRFDFLISNFRLVLNAVGFLLGNSQASEFYMPTFRNTLFHFHRQVGTYLPMN